MLIGKESHVGDSGETDKNDPAHPHSDANGWTLGTWGTSFGRPTLVFGRESKLNNGRVS